MGKSSYRRSQRAQSSGLSRTPDSGLCFLCGLLFHSQGPEMGPMTTPARTAAGVRRLRNPLTVHEFQTFAEQGIADSHHWATCGRTAQALMAAQVPERFRNRAATNVADRQHEPSRRASRELTAPEFLTFRKLLLRKWFRADRRPWRSTSETPRLAAAPGLHNGRCKNQTHTVLSPQDARYVAAPLQPVSR